MDSYSNGNPKRVGLKDIARASGLSISTVCLALNNKPGVSKRAYNKVKTISKELGYSPDPILSALAAHRTRLIKKEIRPDIALLFNPGCSENQTPKPIMDRIRSGAEMKANDLGYNLKCIHFEEEGVSLPRLSQILLSRGVRSLIIVPPNEQQKLYMDWDKFYLASIGRIPSLPGIHQVTGNPFLNTETAFKYLRENGSNRIGFVNDPGSDPFSQNEWTFSYYSNQHLYGSPKDHISTFEVNSHNPLELKSKLLNWLWKENPNGLIFNSQTALSVFSQLRQGVTKDINFIDLDIPNKTEDVCGFESRYEIMGTTAVSLLHERVNRNKLGLDDHTICSQVQGFWRQGNSVKKGENKTNCIA